MQALFQLLHLFFPNLHRYTELQTIITQEKPSKELITRSKRENIIVIFDPLDKAKDFGGFYVCKRCGDLSSSI
jgi:hypothetical protein